MKEDIETLMVELSRSHSENRRLNDKLNMWYMNLTDSLKKQSIEAGMPIAFNKPVNPLFNYA